MKKSWIFIIAVLFLLVLPFGINNFCSADVAGDLDEQVDQVEDKKEEVESRWDYLGKEWKKILLENKFVSGIDSFFKKINFVFVFLFGEDYSLSLTLLVIVILWVFFLFQFSEILKDFTAFSKGTSWIISFGLVILLSYAGVLKAIAKALGWIVFSPEAGWLRSVMLFLVVIILIALFKASSIFGKKFKEKKEERKRELEKLEREKVEKHLEGFERGFEEGSK